MGLTGVGGRQQDGKSKRTRRAPSVHVDNVLKEMGTLRRGRTYVVEFACLLTGVVKDPEEEKRAILDH